MADPTPDPTPDPAPTPEPTPTPDPTPDPPKAPPWGDPENFNAEKAWELIQSLRKEKGDPAKVTDLEQKLADLQAAQQAQMDAIAKGLGLKPDDTPPDPAKLAEQVAEEQAKTASVEARAVTAERMLAVYTAAAEHEASPAALLDSASFLESIKEIDPTDAAALGEAIKTAVERDERFKASITPPFPGGPRTPAPKRAGSLEEAVAARMAPGR